MAYDDADRLLSIDAGGANATTFALDALGRIKTRTTPGPVTDTYGYLGGSEAVTSIITGAVTIKSVIDSAGSRLGLTDGTTSNWLAPDLHGNTALSLSGAAATVANATRYDPYGQVLGTPAGASGTTRVGQDLWKFQGRLDVGPTGLPDLYDAGARFYAPGLGTFTQLDSVMGQAQNPLTMNRFLYALGNPWTFVDPDGHRPCSGRSVRRDRGHPASGHGPGPAGAQEDQEAGLGLPHARPPIQHRNLRLRTADSHC